MENPVETHKERKIGSSEVAAILRSEILKGRWELNDRLPPERELAALYGVARGTVRVPPTSLLRSDPVPALTSFTVIAIRAMRLSTARVLWN